MFDFANSPTVGQIASNGAASYRWDGTKWQVAGAAAGVTTWNGRAGAVVMTGADVTGVGGALAANVPGANFADNAGFAVNQRAYTSGTALAAAAYGHDRWKGGAGGCTYTFTQSGGPATTITITAGTLQQVVEGPALSSGTYTLSWVGTAQGRAGAGSYAASPVAVTATAGANLTLEFNTGTLGQVKLEVGSTATPWVAALPQQDLAKCQRFYLSMPGVLLGGYSISSGNLYASIAFPTTMRATPTIAFTSISYNNMLNYSLVGSNAQLVEVGASMSATGNGFCSATVNASADL